MQIKTIMAAAAVAVSLGAFAQPAFADDKPWSTQATTSSARITQMMRTLDRFIDRQHRLADQRYYADRQIRRDSYAARDAAASSYAMRR